MYAIGNLQHIHRGVQNAKKVWEGTGKTFEKKGGREIYILRGSETWPSCNGGTRRCHFSDDDPPEDRARQSQVCVDIAGGYLVAAIRDRSWTTNTTH